MAHVIERERDYDEEHNAGWLARIEATSAMRDFLLFMNDHSLKTKEWKVKVKEGRRRKDDDSGWMAFTRITLTEVKK